MKSLKKLFGLCVVVSLVSVAVTVSMPAIGRALDSARAESLKESAVRLHAVWDAARIDALTSGADNPVFPADSRNKSTADVFEVLVADGYVSPAGLRSLQAEKFQFAGVAESDSAESALLVSRPDALKARRVVVSVRGDVTLNETAPDADLLP